MKKNLLFALSVFLITIIGLLVFSEASKKDNNDLEALNKAQQENVITLKH